MSASVNISVTIEMVSDGGDVEASTVTREYPDTMFDIGDSAQQIARLAANALSVRTAVPF